MRPVVFLLFLFASSYCLSQEYGVVEIIDANLFELEDGRQIKLAGLDIPSIYHPDEEIKTKAVKTFEVARRKILNKEFLVRVIETQGDSSFYVVILEKSYLLHDYKVNEEFLKYGYGKYFDNVTGKTKQIFQELEAEAKSKERGLWELNKHYEFYDYALNGFPSYANNLKTLAETKNPRRKALEFGYGRMFYDSNDIAINEFTFGYSSMPQTDKLIRGRSTFYLRFIVVSRQEKRWYYNEQSGSHSYYEETELSYIGSINYKYIWDFSILRQPNQTAGILIGPTIGIPVMFGDSNDFVMFISPLLVNVGVNLGPYFRYKSFELSVNYSADIILHPYLMGVHADGLKFNFNYFLN